MLFHFNFFLNSIFDAGTEILQVKSHCFVFDVSCLMACQVMSHVMGSVTQFKVTYSNNFSSWRSVLIRSLRHRRLNESETDWHQWLESHFFRYNLPSCLSLSNLCHRTYVWTCICQLLTFGFPPNPLQLWNEKSWHSFYLPFSCLMKKVNHKLAK